MAKFKQVPQNFLFRKLLKHWGNMVQNVKGDCHDNDFFDVVRNCFDHDKAVELNSSADMILSSRGRASSPSPAAFSAA